MIETEGAVFTARRDRLRETCKAKKIDGYLTFDFSDVLYLSGFPSEGCFVLVGASGDAAFAPPLLLEHLKAVVGREPLKIVSGGPLLKGLEQFLRRNGLKKIGYDDSKLSVSLFKALSAFRSVKWVPLEGLVLKQRMIKDAAELRMIRRACHLTYQSAKACMDSLEEGESELGLARRLEDLYRDGGSPKPAFETIVAFQENAAYPHHVLTDKKLKQGSVVLVDTGSMIEGYRSDLTRTSYFGNMPSKVRKVYEIVKKSQELGIEAVRAGVTAVQVDFVCREYIRKAGYGDHFIHGTGHGVGLDIHEPPRLGVGSKETLKEGMIVTVEPGIYLPGEFGVRIEDTVLVKKNDCEVLTK
jgi:Xaa-Pro aminopeptidase